MTDEQFEALTHRLQEQAAHAPVNYQWKVIALALLGFGYVFLIVAIAVGAFALVIWAMSAVHANVLFAKLGIGVIGLLLLIGRAMWVQIPPPGGIPITQNDAPALFELIDKTREHMRAPHVHQVLVTDEFNAAVTQVPRLGILGWPRNYVILGLPLLQALSPDQFQAVLAHEFGHLSGAHSRLSGWIYRVRAGWMRLLVALEEEDHWATFIFRPFFRWYAPFFGAYSFVIGRAHEYSADRDAASLTSSTQMGDALVRVNVIGSFLSDRFWPSVMKEADTTPEPAAAPYAALAPAIGPEFSGENFEGILHAALSVQTGVADTHPSLKDRLHALGVEAKVPLTFPESAAQRLIGDATARLIDRLDAAWRASVSGSWRERYEHVKQSKEKLGELNQRAAAQELTEEEQWERTYLTDEFGTFNDSHALYAAFVKEYPNHAGGHFGLGRLLLSSEDELGLTYLERAMEVSDDAIMPACELAYSFLISRQRDEEAEEFRKRWVKRTKVCQEIMADRTLFEYDDTFLHHDLEPHILQGLLSQLAEYKDIKCAYLVRKQLRHTAQPPLYVLGVERRADGLSAAPLGEADYMRPEETLSPLEMEVEAVLQRRLVKELKLPDQTYVIILNSIEVWHREVITGVEGSQIWP